MKPITAKFFDGIHSTAYVARLSLDNEKIIIEYQEDVQKVIETWEFESIIIIERMFENRSAIISSKHNPEARLYIENKDFYTYILSQVKSKQIQRTHIPFSWKAIFGFFVVFVIAIVGLLWGYPKLTPYIAKALPFTIDDKLGQWVIKNVTDDKPRCIDPQGLNALNKLIKKISKGTNEKHPFQVQVVDFGPNKINAFATAGNHIVIMSGLINYTQSPDELAGILAHEMGHAIEHHPTDTLLRILGINFVMIATFGSSASYPTQLLHFKYSRDKEAAADQIAIDLLKKAKISVLGLAHFFERLYKKEGNTGEYDDLLEYVSDHPALKSRIEAIQSQAEQKKLSPALTASEWQALKKVCNKKTTDSKTKH